MARLLPEVMAANIELLPDARRYDEAAQLLTGDPEAVAEEGVEWVRELCEDFHIPSLSHWGFSEEHIPSLVERARKSGSMKGNPVDLDPERLAQIVRQSLD